MEKTKLTVRISKSRLENAKIYAKQHATSLSRLIDEYLGRLPDKESHAKSKIVSRLSGVLSQKVSIEDYKEHLENKCRG